jgi:hypothetical protein
VRRALVPVLAFMALATEPHYLADFWHHLTRGRAIVADGRLLDEDRFTFTVPGQPFQDVNWLSQVGYYGLYRAGGLDLVRCVNALALAAALALLTWVCQRRCGSLGPAVVAGVLTFFGLWEVLTIRPQTYSLLLFVVLYALLDGAGRRPWLLWLAPAVLALWANLHGAFPAGLMLIGCFVAASACAAWRRGGVFRDRPTRLLALCLAGSAAATLANPYGWRIFAYVGQTSSTAAVRRIDEWVPPGLDQWIGVAFFTSLLLLAALAVLAWRRAGWRPAARDVCLLGCFLPLACGSVRMVAWWLLLVAPVLAELLAALLPRRADAEAEADRTPSVGAAVVFASMMLAVVFCLPGLQRYNPLLWVSRQGARVEDDLEAVQRHLAAHAGAGRIFSRFEWGEYLTWSCAPGFKVFMDGRIEIYPDEVWERYAAVTTGRADWERILDDYGVDFLLLDASYHARTGLLARVEQSPAWRPAFRCRDAILYVRRA